MFVARTSVARTAGVTPSACHRRHRASRHSHASSCWLVLFLLFMFAVTAAAQEETKDLGEASLEELGNIQVYSASKHMQSTSDAPASVTVITADEIQKYGYRTLADILQSVRGFYVTYDRDYSFRWGARFRTPGRLEQPHSGVDRRPPDQRQHSRSSLLGHGVPGRRGSDRARGNHPRTQFFALRRPGLSLPSST